MTRIYMIFTCTYVAGANPATNVHVLVYRSETCFGEFMMELGVIL